MVALGLGTSRGHPLTVRLPLVLIHMRHFDWLRQRRCRFASVREETLVVAGSLEEILALLNVVVRFSSDVVRLLSLIVFRGVGLNYEIVFDSSEVQKGLLFYYMLL
jgi:hypothetical protein